MRGVYMIVCARIYTVKIPREFHCSKRKTLLSLHGMYDSSHHTESMTSRHVRCLAHTNCIITSIT